MLISEFYTGLEKDLKTIKKLDYEKKIGQQNLQSNNPG